MLYPMDLKIVNSDNFIGWIFSVEVHDLLWPNERLLITNGYYDEYAQYNAELELWMYSTRDLLRNLFILRFWLHVVFSNFSSAGLWCPVTVCKMHWPRKLSVQVLCNYLGGIPIPPDTEEQMR